MRKILIGLGGVIVVLVVGFLVIQLIPFGRDHNNPPVVQEPQWSSPQVRELAKRACFDCHSNESVWPWYSNVAPVSWLIQRDVNEGRQHLNFSNWQGSRRAREASRTVLDGQMPPFYYVWLHPSAGLSTQEKQQLADGLSTLVGFGDIAKASK